MAPVKKFLIVSVLCASALPMPASAYGTYAEDNPFVEAMLRMMEIFGLIDRDRLVARAPYLPGYGPQYLPAPTALGGFPGSPMSGLGGVPGMSPLSGLGGVPGMSPLSGLGGVPGMSPLSGLGGVPGMAPMPGLGGVPGMTGFPGTGVMPGGGWPGAGFPGALAYPGNPAGPRQYGPGATPGLLDGAWELDKGGFVIIRGNAARLYLSREQYQDFDIGYDRKEFWWAPRAGGSSSRYRYQMREGRMILSDEAGNLLLLRRRR